MDKGYFIVTVGSVIELAQLLALVFGLITDTIAFFCMVAGFFVINYGFFLVASAKAEDTDDSE